MICDDIDFYFLWIEFMNTWIHFMILWILFICIMKMYNTKFCHKQWWPLGSSQGGSSSEPLLNLSLICEPFVFCFCTYFTCLAYIILQSNAKQNWMMQEVTSTLTVQHISDLMYQFGVARSNLFFDCTVYFTFNDNFLK